MTIKPIVLLPDPVLRQQSRPIERIDDELLRLADDMLETMYDAPGIGLAAVQTGVPIRMLVIDIAKRSDPEGDQENEAPDPHVFINPEIVEFGDMPSVYEEGCLSIPEQFAEVERPANVTVNYLDREGQQRQINADGLMSTCLQHEIDHLNGVLFIDHISRLKREMVVRKFRKLAKERAKSGLVG